MLVPARDKMQTSYEAETAEFFRNYVGTAARGCPVERSPTIFLQSSVEERRLKRRVKSPWNAGY
jgi:hypothetical protein